MYIFLQTPPNDNIITPNQSVTTLNYEDKRTEWDADVHLISTYGFLAEETKSFAANPKIYKGDIRI